MKLNGIRRGSGNPLLLIHGLGGTWRSWRPVLDRLAAQREIIAVDLPGFGRTPPLAGEVSLDMLADSLSDFLHSHDMIGIDVAGVSMGARLVLELARRRLVGNAVALSPGGFWQGWERTYAALSLDFSVRLVRLLRPFLPILAENPVTRTMLLAQLSARPWDLPAPLVLDEMRSSAAAPSFDSLLRDLTYGPEPQGAPSGSTLGPITIGWGRKDRLCFPKQAQRALELFPDARLHWFDDCGHYPQWDVPSEASQLILANTRHTVAPPAQFQKPKALAVGA